MAIFLRSCPFDKIPFRKHQNVVTILIQYSRICHDIATKSNSTKSAEFPRMVRGIWPTAPDRFRSVGICYDGIWMRYLDNERSFLINQNSNPTFSLFKSLYCLISNGRHNLCEHRVRSVNTKLINDKCVCSSNENLIKTAVTSFIYEWLILMKKKKWNKFLKTNGLDHISEPCPHYFH